MRVDRLTLDGFRNYRRQALELDESCNVIYGENAQGKTNLLEAVVYLSCGRSPRAHGDRELIGFERQDASSTLTFSPAMVHPNQGVNRYPAPGLQLAIHF